MNNTLPGQIELTPDETELRGRIDFKPNHFSCDFHSLLRSSCEAAAELATSLLERDVIPEVRWRYFTDPELNIGLKKSRAEVFESNGTRGTEILQHAHFLPHLKYFIYGPALPQSTIEGFCDIVNDDLLTVELFERLRKYARQQTRKHSIENAGDEFHKLALEVGLDDDMARSVRDAAKSTR